MLIPVEKFKAYWEVFTVVKSAVTNTYNDFIKKASGNYVFDIGKAMDIVKKGGAVKRLSWNEKIMYVFLRDSRVTTSDGSSPIPEGIAFESRAHLCAWVYGREVVVGWSPTQEDLLATDWIDVTKPNKAD